MTKDTSNLVRVLQSELIFLDAGGYSAWAGARWRLPLVFEELPTCPNFNDTTHAVACRNCCLFQLVPLRHQNKPVPCRHIPLNHVGETLDTLYRSGTVDDLRLVVRHWLVRKIAELQAKDSRLQLFRKQDLYQAADPT